MEPLSQGRRSCWHWGHGAKLCGACRGLYPYLGEEALAEAASSAETEQGN